MKKKITNSHDLLIGIASNGDAAAFFSLIAPLLKEVFLQYRSQGNTFNDAGERVNSLATTLFKKIQGNHPENFAEWFHAESHTTAITPDSDSEVFFDREQVSECETVLSETQRNLLRAASKHIQRPQKNNILKFIKTNAVLLSVSTGALALVIGLLQFFLQSETTLTIVLSTKNSQKSFSIPSLNHHTIVLTDTVTLVNKTKPVAHSDTIARIDSVSLVAPDPKQGIKPLQKSYTRSIPLSQTDNVTGQFRSGQTSSEIYSGYSGNRSEKTYQTQTPAHESPTQEQSGLSTTQQPTQPSIPSTQQTEGLSPQ